MSRRAQRRENRIAALQFLYAWELNRPEVLADNLRVFFESPERVLPDSEEADPPTPLPPEKVGPDEEAVPEALPMDPPTPTAASQVLEPNNAESIRTWFSFGEELALGTVENIGEIDAIIRERAKNWDFNRIAKVDLTILRLALYELLHRPDIPPVVTINEAIELSKQFSGPDSRRFINGILDQVSLTLDRPLREAAD
ncbi:MAG: transcription antitermination factor NusB [Opitutales bacterium]